MSVTNNLNKKFYFIILQNEQNIVLGNATVFSMVEE